MNRIKRILIILLVVDLFILSSGTVLYISKYNSQMEMPYYSGVYTTGGLESWNKDMINISMRGTITNYNLVCLQDVLNEWNTKVQNPKLGYSDTCPDIIIFCEPFNDEEWAGATWTTTDGDKTITKGYINVKTSWPFAREHVIRHELGHALGLGYHSNHPDSTMYGWAIGVSEWSQEDIDIIEQLYSGNRYPSID